MDLLQSIELYWDFSSYDIELERATRPSEMLDLALNSRRIQAGKGAPWEYKTLDDIAKEWVVGGSIDGPRRNPDYYGLKSALAEAYGMQLGSLLAYAEEGLKIYVQDDGEFREGTPDDEHWYYFMLMVKNDASMPAMYEAPLWAKNLYVWRVNHQIWSAIYCDLPGTDHADYRFVKQAKLDATNYLTELRRRGPAPVSSGFDRYPPELRAAIEAFEAVYDDPAAITGRSPKAALTAWLEEHKPELSDNANDRISTLANWRPSGGAPKTPGE